MKRYDIYYSWDSLGANIERHEEESVNGDWVKWEDVQNLVKQTQLSGGGMSDFSTFKVPLLTENTWTTPTEDEI